MSSNVALAKRTKIGRRRGARERLLEEYRLRRRHLESYYDPEDDYHFAEAKEEFGADSTDLEWFESAEGDTIDDMSSALNESQRRAVRWRIRALRCVGVINTIALIGGCLPCWILIVGANHKSILNEKHIVYCEEQLRGRVVETFSDQECIYYRHELSTYTAFTGLWMFGTLLQSLFMAFTSWRLHNKSFQAVVSIWTFFFMVLGLAVSFYTVTNLTLMSEDFNWRITSPTPIYAKMPGDLKYALSTSIRAFVAILYGLLLTQALWMYLMHQVLQFGLNLQEFGAEICGDSIESAAAENASAIHSAVDRLLDPRLSHPFDATDFYSSTDDAYSGDAYAAGDAYAGDAYTGDAYSPNSHSPNDSPPPFPRDVDERQFLPLDDSDDEEMPSAAAAPNAPSLQSVMDLMSTLTSTMTALNKKIDDIESRVGDGSALLVMPPGENQWDAKKN